MDVGKRRSRTRVAVGFCYKEVLVSLAVLHGGGETEARSHRVKARTCLLLYLVSKMVPGIQSVLRKYSLSE